MKTVGVLLVLAVITCIHCANGDRMLKSINVHHQKHRGEPADNPITEIHGDADINFGYGGGFVYLSSEWTENKDEALTNISMRRNFYSCEGDTDLAWGAGGSFRCLQFERDPNMSKKIRDITLIREGTTVGPDGYLKPWDLGGWEACSNDINGGRDEGTQGTYLYLCWKTVTV